MTHRKEIATLIKKGLIQDVTKVALTPEMLRDIPASYARQLRMHVRIADAYRFRYLSQGLRITGYMVLPKRLPKKSPCIIYNRGGSRSFGQISPRFALGTLSEYASWGYVVIGSQYRGNDGSDGKEGHGGGDLNDVLRLREVLKGIPQADVARLGMVGWSRGGMMTYLLAAKVRWIRATATIAGLTDLVRNVRMRPEMKSYLKKLYNPTHADLVSRSAVYWSHKFSRRTPMLLMHGTADWRVSVHDSIDLAKKLLERKVPHRLMIFEGGDHALTEYRAEMMRQIRSWFDRFVRDGEKMPNMKPHGD